MPNDSIKNHRVDKAYPTKHLASKCFIETIRKTLSEQIESDAEAK